MALTRLHKSLIQFTIILMVTAGFSYQTWTISNAYFKYQTSTFVKLEDYLDPTIVPQLGFRQLIRIRYGMPLSEIFQTTNNISLIDSKKESHIEEFVQGMYRYVSVKSDNATQLSPQELYLRRYFINRAQCGKALFRTRSKELS